MPSSTRASGPPDQADGLRQRFGLTPTSAGAGCQVLALVHNPFVVFGGVAMERLASGLSERGLRTLVVDAADTASSPHELADVDLGACIEPLSAQVSYLAARGLPKRWIDAQGGTGGFITALAQAAPQANVVLLHASAVDLRRLFMGRRLCPMVLAGEQAESLTHAYSAVKLLAQRAGMTAFDLLAVQDSGSRKSQPNFERPVERPAERRAERQAERLAQRLGDCSERFLNVALRDWAAVDPASDGDDPPSPALRNLLSAQLRQIDLQPTDSPGVALGGSESAALLSRVTARSGAARAIPTRSAPRNALRDSGRLTDPIGA